MMEVTFLMNAQNNKCHNKKYNSKKTTPEIEHLNLLTIRVTGPSTEHAGLVLQKFFGSGIKNLTKGFAVIL